MAWQIDLAHSEVLFSVKHMMISTVRGKFSRFSGTVDANEQNPTDAQIAVQIEAASLDTGNEQRDGHLRSPDFVDADNWPSIRFDGTRIEGNVADEFSLYGDITIRDVTREIELRVTNEGSVVDPWGWSRIGFSAKTKLDRRDFGLLYNQALEAGGFVVGDEIEISIDAEFTAVL